MGARCSSIKYSCQQFCARYCFSCMHMKLLRKQYIRTIIKCVHTRFWVKELTEFREIDLSLATEKPMPEIRLLVLEEYVSGVKNEIISLSMETEISEFVSIVTRPVEGQANPDVWYDFFVTVDWVAVFSAVGVVASVIQIGTFIHKAFKFLRRRRRRGKIKKLKMNCTASVNLALNHLRNIGASIRNSQIRLVYLSNVLAYYCIAIFSSPIASPKELHVITAHIDGRISSYNLVAL